MDLTHTLTITMTGNYPHGQKTHAQISISGEGGLCHMVSAFKSLLIAAGYSASLADKLNVITSNNDWKNT